MHWSTARALNTIARERHAQLDAALTDRIHRDPDPQAKTDLFSGSAGMPSKLCQCRVQSQDATVKSSDMAGATSITSGGELTATR